MPFFAVLGWNHGAIRRACSHVVFLWGSCPVLQRSFIDPPIWRVQGGGDITQRLTCTSHVPINQPIDQSIQPIEPIHRPRTAKRANHAQSQGTNHTQSRWHHNGMHRKGGAGSQEGVGVGAGRGKRRERSQRRK